jgi:hypothetical protein
MLAMCSFKTRSQLNHLIDLKQKYANVIEARLARDEAEQTRKQAEATHRLGEESARQTEAAHKLAEETARQGNTLMVFTIVTIVFVSYHRFLRACTLLMTIPQATSFVYGGILCLEHCRVSQGRGWPPSRFRFQVHLYVQSHWNSLDKPTSAF